MARRPLEGAEPPPGPTGDGDANAKADANAGLHRVSVWFSVTGLLLLATVLAAAFMQVRQHALLNQTVQYQDDYLVLSLYQLQVETLRLREQLHQEVDQPADANALQLRYDIFVSQISLLGSDRAQRLRAAGCRLPAAPACGCCATSTTSSGAPTSTWAATATPP